MVDSCLRIQVARSTVVSDEKACLRNTIGDSLRIIFFVPSIFILVAICSVPDSPEQLASICEKYNSPSACSVW
ncbi:hypothetical protein [Prochlorococcus sp. MIT 1223]|uniref:hypothetical protein n=1 Tax=Prochlorococcus sp. MIT 1223 TaxID=3096217 RepID=UPI002A75BC95|nr:hypothetical protein [Prochlorococcus sp. MIT 1223]